MNLIKNKRILEFIQKFKQIYQMDGYEFVDYWDADQCAIGIKKKNKLIYISTYGLKAGLFYYEIEDLDSKSAQNYEVIKIEKSVNEKELFEAINEYLI